MKQEVLDLYDNYFNKTDKTIIRRVDEIPEDLNIMQSYIIIENNGKYLIEKNQNSKYALPGGHVLSGETPEEALLRELKEELGIININFKKIDMIKYPYNNYIFNVYFSNTLIDLSSLTYQQEEVSDVLWLDIEEIYFLVNTNQIPRGYAYIIKKYIFGSVEDV